jgi:molybdopterin converting factor small subunit
MKLTLKLYAGLSPYLPSGAENNAVQLDIGDEMTPNGIIEEYKLPPELVHIVLLNGVYVKPEERDEPLLKEGDVLAMWPPVAGGNGRRRRAAA